MKKLTNEIVVWLKDYAENNNRKSFVIGVSGGVDSALVSTLCAMTGLPTHCVLLPCESKVDQTDRGYAHISWLRDKHDNVNFHRIDLTDTFRSFVKTCGDTYSDKLGYANSKSRIRMVTLYQIATCVGGLVVGTGNKIEDYHVFFYTKFGDGGVDIAPIGDLTKTEVRQMSRDLGVLPELSEAIPTDGLWDDARTDESQLGASYEELEWIVELLENNNNNLTPEMINIMTLRQQEVLRVYNKWHTAGKHKSEPIPTFRRK